jgi:hypothetical protein
LCGEAGDDPGEPYRAGLHRVRADDGPERQAHLGEPERVGGDARRVERSPTRGDREVHDDARHAGAEPVGHSRAQTLGQCQARRTRLRVASDRREAGDQGTDGGSRRSGDVAEIPADVGGDLRITRELPRHRPGRVHNSDIVGRAAPGERDAGRKLCERLAELVQHHGGDRGRLAFVDGQLLQAQLQGADDTLLWGHHVLGAGHPSQDRPQDGEGPHVGACQKVLASDMVRNDSWNAGWAPIAP